MCFISDIQFLSCVVCLHPNCLNTSKHELFYLISSVDPFTSKMIGDRSPSISHALHTTHLELKPVEGNMHPNMPKPRQYRWKLQSTFSSLLLIIFFPMLPHFGTKQLLGLLAFRSSVASVLIRI
mmetsp:Transcript_19739/g.27536  ORF Transcript_19739/g.27536 Transcript_19739/m.27536 type:complete len:124 (+) Transcript_19739:127-498(+)